MGLPFLSEVEWVVDVRRHRFHDHRELQILWVLEGHMGLVLDNRRYEEPAGSCYVIPPGKRHRVFQRDAAPRVVFLDMRLTAEPPSPMMRFLEAAGQHVVYRARPEPLRAGAAELRGALALAGLRRAARVQAVLWSMLEEMTAHTPDTTAAEPDDTGDLRLRIADSVMRDSLAQPPDVAGLAAAAGLSRSQLTRLYKQHRGVGPAERLRQLRIEKARELLASTTLSVKEVAHVCGFVCPNHFCRVFLKVTGSTPTAFREQHLVQPRTAIRGG
jgi:AraC-like DNA-binding protein